MIALITGFIAGLGHVLSGPDHMVAIASLAAASRRHAWRAGLRWGLGHTAGVLLVGLGCLLLRGFIPMDLISGWSERMVGVVLIGIGIWGLLATFRKRLHAHEHEHDGSRHAHVHVHGAATAHAPVKPSTHVHTHTALAVGTLHGLAGGSHILGVLPALAFPTFAGAVVYLAAFGIGTIVAMICFAATVGFISQGSARRGLVFYQTVLGICSFAAIGVGIYWLVA